MHKGVTSFSKYWGSGEQSSGQKPVYFDKYITIFDLTWYINNKYKLIRRVYSLITFFRRFSLVRLRNSWFYAILGCAWDENDE